MEKINGYTREEAASLVRYLAEGRRAGRTLTSLFSRYGKEHGRAAGSVRNYYYKLLHTQGESAKAVLEGSSLRAGQVRPFTEAEADSMLREILAERKKGVSVRRAIHNVCGGDAKKVLRYQNKYRNLIKKQPALIEETAKEMGLETVMPARRSDFLQRRLEREINDLYDRLAVALREENDRLKKAVERLTEENEILRRAGKKRVGTTADRDARMRRKGISFLVRDPRQTFG